MVVAEIDFAEMVYSLILLFFMVVYFMLLFSVVVDLYRDPDPTGVEKAVWFLVLLVVPVLSIIVYLVTRGDEMTRRANASSRAAQESPGSSPADEIARGKELLDSGTISAEEFEALKRKALA